MPDQWEPRSALGDLIARAQRFASNFSRASASAARETRAVLGGLLELFVWLARAVWRGIMETAEAIRADFVAAVKGVAAQIVGAFGRRPSADGEPSPGDGDTEVSRPVRRRTRTIDTDTGEEKPGGLGQLPLPARIAMWSGASLAVMLAPVIAFIFWVTADLPPTENIWSASDSTSIAFVDRYKRVILRVDAQGAPPVDIKSLQPYVPQAIVAIEDRRFYDHGGVDFEGLSRAVIQNFKEGRVVQGGSTLTQQLAKNLFLSNERTLRRKAQEVVLALWLELKFTKDEILALYMSRVFFGAGAYGIEAASERYFDKPATRLSLSEAALLAGLLKAPSKMNPAVEDTSAKARALLVLDAMVEQGYITRAQRDEAAAAPLPIKRRSPVGNFGYFRDWIEPQLDSIMGDRRDDYIVETTLDLDAQRAAERAVADTLGKDGEAMGVTQAALLSLDDSGGVRAMVGGSGYGDTQFNRATQARRQPGSSFKYFIYLTAMAMPEYSPWTVKIDQPITIGDWSPGNYNDEYNGPVTLTNAFARSLNMVAIELANEVGGDKVIDTARRLGVRTRLYNYRSLALGAQELPLIEMTQAYAAMSNRGFPVTPHGITSVKTPDGKVIYEWRPPDAERAIDDRAFRAMNLMMNRVVEGGTGTRAKLPGFQVAGKTGTGNDYRDAWFVGFTSGITTGVWVGNDNFAETKKVTGGGMPAQIWAAYMPTALRNETPRPLAMPDPTQYVVEPDPSQIDVNAAADPSAPTVVGAPLLSVTGGAEPARQSGSLEGPE